MSEQKKNKNKHALGKTVKVALALSEELYKTIKKQAELTFGDRVTNISMFLEMTLRKELGVVAN